MFISLKVGLKPRCRCLLGVEYRRYSPFVQKLWTSIENAKAMYSIPRIHLQERRDIQPTWLSVAFCILFCSKDLQLPQLCSSGNCKFKCTYIGSTCWNRSRQCCAFVIQYRIDCIIFFWFIENWISKTESHRGFFWSGICRRRWPSLLHRRWGKPHRFSLTRYLSVK